MHNKLVRISALALTVLLLMAPFVLAMSHKQGESTGASTKQTTPSKTKGMQEHSGMTTSATVVTVDKEQRTFTILSEDGKPVEFKASESMMSTLQVGDVVEVSIRPMQHGQQSQPGQSGKTSHSGSRRSQ